MVKKIKKQSINMDKMIVISGLIIIILLVCDMFFTEEEMSHDLTPEQIGWYHEIINPDYSKDHKHLYLLMTPHGVERVDGFKEVSEFIEIYMETYVYGLTVEDLEELRELESKYLSRKRLTANYDHK